MDRWYYTRDNKKRIGPHTLAELQRLLATGVLEASDMVLNEGKKGWAVAASIPELAGEQQPKIEHVNAHANAGTDTSVPTKSRPWRIFRGNSTVGPYSTEQMKEFITSQPPRLSREDPVERFGITGRMRAKQFGELFPLVKEYYIIRENVKYGPYTVERMKEFIATVPPVLTQQDWVQAEGPPTFAGQMDELFHPSNGGSRKGVIYLVTIPCLLGFYKIGKTINIDQRVYQFGILFPEKPEVVHKIETNHIDYAETHWHKRFAHKRANGEWFGLGPADVEEFCRCSQMSFPLEYKADFVAVVRCSCASPMNWKDS
jgi:hypothetical protein